MNTCASRLITMAQRYPQEIATVLNGKALTYGQLHTRIAQAVTSLKSMNLLPGQRVALALANLNETIVLFYALNAMGISVVMLHPLSSGKLLRQRVDEVHCTTVFVLDVLSPRYGAHLNGLNVMAIEAIHSATGWQKALLRFKRTHLPIWREANHPDPLDELVDEPNAVILFSSGTTGLQKAISLSNAAMNALVDQMESCVAPERGVDGILAVLPFFHGFGLGIGMHTVLALGGKCVLVPRLHRRSVITTLLTQKPTYLAAVPYFLRILLASPQFVNADLSFIKQVFVGGESVPLPLISAFNACLEKGGSHARIQVGYGTTETLTAVTLMPKSDSGKPGVGLPLPGNTLAILNDEGQRVGPWITGEILVSGPTLMNGYLNHPELNANTLITRHGQRWVNTHDVGMIDDHGILHFSHRNDDLLKIKGYLINPHDIEAALYTIDGITEAKAMADEAGRLVVVISTHPQMTLKSLKSKTAQIWQDLDGWMKPYRMVVMSSLPKNEMRKLDRRQTLVAITAHSNGFRWEWFP
jgi:long-chain acyl-CoA synthetase